MAWLIYAFASAVTAAATAILAKIGVEGVPSTLATAFRTTVVLIIAWNLLVIEGDAAESRAGGRAEIQREDGGAAAAGGAALVDSMSASSIADVA